MYVISWFIAIFGLMFLGMIITLATKKKKKKKKILKKSLKNPKKGIA
jgi:preprotein translocase subunit SecG